MDMKPSALHYFLIRWTSNLHIKSEVLRKLTMVLLATAVLGSCGGGGGSNDNTPDPDPGPIIQRSTLTLSGSVVMGPVSNATVEAYCHDTTPAVLIGESSSDTQGHYSINTNRACADVVELQVSGGSYVDEATGDTVTGPGTPWLHALVDGTSGGQSQVVQITALTEVVFAKVTLAGAKPTAASLATVYQLTKSELAQLLIVADLDPLSTPPSTAFGTGEALSDTGLAYTLILGALSYLSSEHAEGFSGVVSQLSNSGLVTGDYVRGALSAIVTFDEVLGRMGLTADAVQTLVRPAALTARAMVSAGDGHTLALANDGNLWAWGSNLVGALGDGTTDDRSTPVRVAGQSNVVAVAAGSDWSMALRADGTVWTWGGNTEGQLGYPAIYKFTPNQVPGLSNVIAIQAGSHHALAVKADGTVWAWGANGEGELGVPLDDPSLYPGGYRYAPQPVSRLPGVTHIAAGASHSVALHADGTVSTWGANYRGQLGYDTAINSNGAMTISLPKMVPGLQNVIWISAGESSSAAVKVDGTLVSWGENAIGQFGNGQFGQYMVVSPASAAELANIGQSEIAESAAIALRKDGAVATSGSAYWGQLGNGQVGDDFSRNIFATVPELSRIVQVSMGSQHVAALDADGNIWTWGSNFYGQLGRSSSQTTTQGDPVSATPGKVAELNLGPTQFNFETSPGGDSNTPTPTPTLTYEQLSKMLTREFSGKDYEVRLCSDSVDELFRNGVGTNTEPTWPGIWGWSISFTPPIGCSSFGADQFAFYHDKFQRCKSNYFASDYEAVGRRGYDLKIPLAFDNLTYWYSIRSQPVPIPDTAGEVCVSR